MSHHENYSRMRLKLCPNLGFNPHTDASNLRDNTGWLSRRRSSETPLSLTSWSAAVRTELDDDTLPEEDLRSLLSEPEPAEEVTREEKLVLSQECELVTLMTSVRGRLELTTTHASFCDLSPLQDDGERHDFKVKATNYVNLGGLRRKLPAPPHPAVPASSHLFCVSHDGKVLLSGGHWDCSLRGWSISRAKPLFSVVRHFVATLKIKGSSPKKIQPEAQRAGVLFDGPDQLFCQFHSKDSQQGVFKNIGPEASQFADLEQSVSGRTVTSFRPHPKVDLDLENPATFRDLSKPIGVVNPKNVAEVKAKYDNFEDPSGVIAKFHYGTHYSNSAGVLHYLVRVEPFTSLHVELQSGRFDVADRQFHSIPQTWKLLMDNPNDVKELTPEFFFFPEFLKNLNGFDLGLLQGTKERVTDVVLPAWASSPEDFIFKHRRALECEYVSAHIHEWIDLIFGYKQKGPKAVEALNVFYYCSYEGAVDLDALKSAVEREAMEGMINNFGQTPCQLLREPHPQRLSLAEAATRQLRPDLTQHLDKIRPFTIMEDGTVNVHTIRDGQYLRTLHPVGCVDPRAEVGYLALSHLGHITFTANDKSSNSIHVYSVNGVHLGSKYVSGRVTGLVTVGENVVVVDDAGDLTISRLYGLRPIYDVPLHVPVQTIVATANNTHLLLPLRDGNLVVVGVPPHGSS
ncbi:hypothetical protein FOCC_FOCC002203 [Frankliniella occidentalis]|nr:hypothetical protein FOCC_FOCC002203 [Frankliniella occidentalis]